MSENKTCIKCGFEITHRGVVEYKDRCYASKCGWEDRDVEEHLHVACPACGFVTAEPCVDYAANKAKFARPAAPAVAVPNYQPSLYSGSYGRSRVDAAWDTKDAICDGCPVEK